MPLAAASSLRNTTFYCGNIPELSCWHHYQSVAFRSSSSRGKRKRRKGKKKKKHHVSQKLLNGLAGPSGRLVMTEKRLSEDPILHDLARGNNSAKGILHDSKSKLLFQQHITHDVEEFGHQHMFFATTTLSFDSDVVALMNLSPDMADHVRKDDGCLHLVCTGAATSKRRAEMLAAVDALVFLEELGIDARKPPNFKARLRAKEEEAAKELRAEAKRQFQLAVARAQMLLELLDVSRPKYSLEYVSYKNEWVATVSLFLRGRLLTVEGPPGTSKVDAKGKAIVAIANSQDIEDCIGKDLMDEYNELVEKSPAEHIATLRVQPLPDEVLDDLEDALGTGEDRSLRAQQHALALKEYHERAASYRQRQIQRERLRQPPEDIQRRMQSSINQALWKEEKEKLRMALENPDGPQANMKTTREALPITKIRNQFVEALRSEQVLVVSGGTGSGKSTQCPQYIIESSIAEGRGAETQVIVTQPRRIAAISVAERVAAERDERVGHSVGYSVRFKSEPPRRPGGTIEFMTTGVLLRKLMGDPLLGGVSHVLIDEVHERDINTDFLLILLRDLLTRRPELRVVLMSATLSAEDFAAYFAQARSASDPPVPVLSVPTKPRYPVDVFYLEDLARNESEGYLPDMQELAESLLQYKDSKLKIELEEALEEDAAADQLEELSRAEDEGKSISDSESDSDGEGTESSSNSLTPRIETLKRAVSLRASDAGQEMPVFDQTIGNEVDSVNALVSLVCMLARHLSKIETSAGRSGSILCFLPGWDEIKEATAELDKTTDHSLRDKMNILPLHSTIPHDDQKKVFEPAADGTVKIILATNIAESSVTINDVLAVVDTGLVRELNYDAESSMSTMTTNQSSRASATQRLGRAGRVAPGRCYRLYSRGDFEVMSERPTPEIQRTSLEATCLQTCSLTPNGVAPFLRSAMDPPPEESVSFALDRLAKLGAIDTDDGTERLTPLGRYLSRLPLDPAIGRMLALGVVMKCLDPILKLAACLSSRNVFYSPIGEREEAMKRRKSFSETSDVAAMVDAYESFWEIVAEEGWAVAREWAFENFISISAMVSIQSVHSQLLRELSKLGLVPRGDLQGKGYGRHTKLRTDASVNENADNQLLCKALWAASTPGHLAVRRKLGSFGTLRTRMDDHAGIHPSSVAFLRKPPGHGVKLDSWYLYREMVLSSQIFLRDVTALAPEQMMLFGGYTMKSFTSSGATRAVLDDWIVTDSYCSDTVDVLVNARSEINLALEEKVMSPKRQMSDAAENLVDSVSNMYSMLDDDNTLDE